MYCVIDPTMTGIHIKLKKLFYRICLCLLLFTLACISFAYGTIPHPYTKANERSDKARQWFNDANHEFGIFIYSFPHIWNRAWTGQWLPRVCSRLVQIAQMYYVDSQGEYLNASESSSSLLASSYPTELIKLKLKTLLQKRQWKNYELNWMPNECSSI